MYREIAEYLRIVSLQNATKTYRVLRLRKNTYRKITEYLRIVSLHNATKTYGVSRYVGFRRVWKLTKYYDA